MLLPSLYSRAGNGQESPCSILLKAYEQLDQVTSGEYTFSYRRKSIFSADTVNYTGAIGFASKRDAAFRTYFFTLKGRQSILRSDTTAYEISEEKKQYSVGSTLQNTTYIHCYNSITGYGNILTYCKDTACKLSYAGIAAVGKFNCNRVTITFKGNENIVANIELFVDRKTHLIRKMIYRFTYMGDDQFEEITLSEFNLYKKQGTGLTSSYFTGKEKYLKDTYSLIVPDNTSKQKIADTLRTAPDFTLEADNGNFIQLSKLENPKLIIIDFWYISCYPCLKASPVLSRLSEKYGDKGLRILGVNPYDNIASIRQHKLKHPVTYTLLSATKETSAAFQISSYPTIYILDKDLKIVKRLEGYSERLESDLEEIIRKELGL